MAVRLQKIIASAGLASRRAAEKLIAEGRVTVNGKTVSEPGSKADPQSDDIRVDGRRLKGPQHHRYFLLNKPRGYVTTRSDPERRPTVMDLLTGVREYVYPVGRLDFDSEGLLILTNDGDLAAQLTHPKHEVERVYEAEVLGVPDTYDLDRLAKGVVIEGRRTSPAQVEPLPEWRTHGDTSMLRITIHEGRTRQVRRMCDAIGHPVRTLRRVRIGPLADRRLRPGAYRELTADEVNKLKRSGLSPEPRSAKAGRVSGPSRRAPRPETSARSRR